jgi:hypothetical protein
MIAGRPKLSLFLIYFLFTGVSALAGWLGGEVFSGLFKGFLGAFIGGSFGVVIASFSASRFASVPLVDSPTVFRFAFVGFAMGMLVGSYFGGELLIVVVAVIGAGLGATFGRYLETFFDYEPPQRLF